MFCDPQFVIERYNTAKGAKSISTKESVCKYVGPFHGPTSGPILMKLGMQRHLHLGHCMNTLFLAKAKPKAKKGQKSQSQATRGFFSMYTFIWADLGNTPCEWNTVDSTAVFMKKKQKLVVFLQL